MSAIKDQVRGRVKKMKGKIMEVSGKLVGNRTLEVKGKVEGIFGEAQAKLGDIKQEIKKEIRQSKKSA